MTKDDFNLQPILHQLAPSQEQIKPILARNKDIVVTAGAGTGKTRTLVARFLSLVAENVPLRSIVAVTFTKKAAREMRNRIREEVRIYLRHPELTNQEISFWRTVYENLDAARISTIHSLAADILRQHPAEMDLDPGFELLEEGQTARLKAQAVEAALSWGSEEPEAAVIFPLFGAWRLRRVIAELLSKRLDVSAAFEKGTTDIWHVWKPLLIEPISAFIDDPDVASALDELLTYETNGILLQADEKGDLLVEDLRIVIESWKKIKEAREKLDWITISRCLGPLGSHLKQKGRKDNWSPANPRELIKEIQLKFKSYIGLDELDLAVDQKLAREVIPGLCAVFNHASQWYDTAKDQLNGLDFDDLERYSLQLLQNHPEVRTYWQNQINALLVDEYQDTNNRQRDLVNILNEMQNQLFIVGDGKQSIYRFRGADVAVFRQEQEIILDRGNSFQLSTSYRAHPVLLQNLNTLLEPVLGIDTSLPYVEPFSPLSPGRQGSSRYSHQPFIELHLAAGTKADGAGRTAAEAVAARILEIIENANNSEQSISGDPLKFGDFAVLCRASGSFSEYETAFEKAGIPYLTIAGKGFYDRPEIRDLLNALDAFSDPQNDLALTGLMRSPIVGLPDDVLLLFRDLQRQEEEISLYEVIKENSDLVEEEFRERVVFLINLLGRYSNLVGRLSAADILGKFLEETGYLAAMAMGGYYRNIQNMKKLVTDAQNSGIVGVSDFLNSVTELRNVAVREGEAASVAEGAVQVMTVHQAKGLEFPIVILGDVSKKDRFGRDILIDPVFGIVPPLKETRISDTDPKKPELLTGTSLAYEIALERERLREEAESNRLFYVAATRAQEMLILSGVIGKLNKDQTLSKLGGWLEKINHTLGLSELSYNFNVQGDSIHAYQLRQSGLEADLFVYENQVEFELEKQINDHDPFSFEGVQEIPDLKYGRNSESISEVTPPVIYRATASVKKAAAPARIVGDVVHRALQLWKFPYQGDNEFLEWTVKELKIRGVIRESEVKNGFRRIKDIIDHFQDHELFNRMINAETLYHEVPYSINENGSTSQSGVIDALFKEKDQWFIVEFKSDEIRDKSRFDWVWQNTDYHAQVGRYIKAVEMILGEKPEAILCFLNYEKRIHLVVDQW